jgi:hypothetical protein
MTPNEHDEERPTGFPEPPGDDPGDRSHDDEAHHVLNNPIDDPDETEWRIRTSAGRIPAERLVRAVQAPANRTPPRTLRRSPPNLRSETSSTTEPPASNTKLASRRPGIGRYHRRAASAAR